MLLIPVGLEYVDRCCFSLVEYCEGDVTDGFWFILVFVLVSVLVLVVVIGLVIVSLLAIAE